MSHRRYRVAGDEAVERNRKKTAQRLSRFIGSAIPAGVLAITVVDIVITPIWVISFLKAHGHPVGWGPLAVAIVESLAQTGILLSLYDRLLDGVRGSRLSVMLVIMAIVLALSDAAMDVGAITAMTYGTDVAANIIPPHPSPEYSIVAAVAFGFFLCWAPLLNALLARDPDAPIRGGLGSQYIRAGIDAGGHMLSWLKRFLVPIGTFAMLAMDVILSPQMATSTLSRVVLWCYSLFTTVFVIILWHFVENTDKQFLGVADRTWTRVAWLLMGLDTVTDVFGYQTAIYGDGHHIVWRTDFSLLALLGDLVVIVMCSTGERMSRELVHRKSDEEEDARAGRPDPSRPSGRSSGRGDSDGSGRWSGSGGSDRWGDGRSGGSDRWGDGRSDGPSWRDGSVDGTAWESRDDRPRP